MKLVALRSFVEEYESIQKAAGLKQIGNAVKKLPESLKSKTKQMASSLTSHPKAQKAISYLSDPTNIADLSHSVANIASRLGH